MAGAELNFRVSDFWSNNTYDDRKKKLKQLNKSLNQACMNFIKQNLETLYWGKVTSLANEGILHTYKAIKPNLDHSLPWREEELGREKGADILYNLNT